MMSSPYQVPEVNIPDSKDIKDFGLQDDFLEEGEHCLVILGDSGVVRGWIENVNEHGNRLPSYDVNTYIGDKKRLHEDVPFDHVHGIGLEDDKSKDARREKYLRVSRYFVSWTIHR